MADEKTTPEPTLYERGRKAVGNYIYEKTLPINPFGQVVEALDKAGKPPVATPVAPPVATPVATVPRAKGGPVTKGGATWAGQPVKKV